MNIEEIKARVEIGHETDSHAYRDIPALIAEVERLRSCKCVDKCKLVCMLDEYDKIIEERDSLIKENYQNVAFAEAYKNICDKCGLNFGALLDKAKALQAENATLKKALEISANQDNFEHCKNDCSGKYSCVECLIHQAEQSMHESRLETHGDAGKDENS